MNTCAQMIKTTIPIIGIVTCTPFNDDLIIYEREKNGFVENSIIRRSDDLMISDDDLFIKEALKK